MANRKHLAILKKGVAAWNKWREEHPEVRPNLSSAHFGGTNLGGADLSGAGLFRADLSGAKLRCANLVVADLGAANLTDADLRGANLGEADLFEANLFGANLVEAHLAGANLGGANLGGADLTGADLNLVNLTGADLGRANVSKAHFGWTVFVNNDLSKTKGLATADHIGPSSIGIDTIFRSGGKIPEVFLRGAGVPDSFITYLGSLAGRPIQFHSCFISYSSRDRQFAKRLHEGLQAKGVRCWFAPEDGQGGGKLHEQIIAAIRLHDKLLLLLSENSMRSEWVKIEILNARKRELTEGRRVLFPIGLADYETICGWKCIDANTGDDLAIDVREYFIPDFSNWKNHRSYQKAFDRLLRDLQAEDSKRPSP
jgi:hypothetical protein